MNESYDDIRSRIAEAPTWWDEQAVPRYGAFEPSRCADIYCDEAVLVEIQCQSCHRSFLVAFSRSRATLEAAPRSLADAISTRDLEYGDPPNVGCCMSGASMNSEAHRVAEYWSRMHPEFTGADGLVTDVPAYFKWRRDTTKEIDIRPTWVTSDDF